MATPKCCACEHARKMNSPKNGTAGSWRSGHFSQVEYVCNHPKHFSVFSGKTAPKTCPLRTKSKEED